ncbi:MAG: iron chelate uptake ABC transporter family permease subunit [Anaerolineae bacterium]|nr:iron chelate uptake ABC transporter family permease subunit [Anaerolineae bacterium]
MPASGRPRRAWSRAGILLALSLSLAGVIILATSLGTVAIPFAQVAGMVARRLLGWRFLAGGSPQAEAIILQIRLPRVVTAAVVGSALAAAGTVFQGLLRNPMADPYIIGTSGGAALGATLALILPWQVVWLGFTPVPILAFAGAMSAVLIVYRVARVGPRTPITTLLLTGFALSSLMAAVMSFLMLAGTQTLQRVVLWTMGGTTASGWTQLRVVTPLILVGVMLAFLLAHDLNAFLLGEEQAAHLGVNVERRKLALLMVGSLLTAAAVSVSGLVGFVGLVVPHVARLLFGPDHRFLLPAAALVGAIFLVLADLVARLLLSPAEIPVGIITALIGAPFFIYLLRRSKREVAF